MEKLTPELEKQIKAAETLNQLEDIYAPYKSKRKTKAQLAREAGLGDLADKILANQVTADEFANSLSGLINKEHKFETEEKVEQGIQDIIIDQQTQTFRRS